MSGGLYLNDEDPAISTYSGDISYSEGYNNAVNEALRLANANLLAAKQAALSNVIAANAPAPAGPLSTVGQGVTRLTSQIGNSLNPRNIPQNVIRAYTSANRNILTTGLIGKPLNATVNATGNALGQTPIVGPVLKAPFTVISGLLGGVGNVLGLIPGVEQANKVIAAVPSAVPGGSFVQNVIEAGVVETGEALGTGPAAAAQLVTGTRYINPGRGSILGMTPTDARAQAAFALLQAAFAARLLTRQRKTPGTEPYTVPGSGGRGVPGPIIIPGTPPTVAPNWLAIGSGVLAAGATQLAFPSSSQSGAPGEKEPVTVAPQLPVPSPVAIQLPPTSRQLPPPLPPVPSPVAPNNTPARSGSGSTTPRRQFYDPDAYKGARLLNRR